ncbi:MAG: hypothetical protein ACD_73C00440G0004 [uncultured bacterium]|nr:MAG: hypothetical protein ACD_73C00440G0004 [uncultured bacterium]
MEIFLFIAVFLLVPAAAVVIVLYLRSGFTLLELVQKDEALWKELGEPHKIRMGPKRDGTYTITPIGPWLTWVWHAQASCASSSLVSQLQKTSLLLKIGLVLFTLDAIAIAVLVF